jgi:hypothetical protein
MLSKRKDLYRNCPFLSSLGLHSTVQWLRVWIQLVTQFTGTWSQSLLWIEKKLRRSSIEFGELNQLDHVYAAFACFTLIEERMRQSKFFGDLTLCQASLFARGFQLLQESVISHLERSRPRLARFSSLGFPWCPHPSSVSSH